MNEHLVESFNSPAQLQTWLNSLKEKGKYGVKIETVVYFQARIWICAVRWSRNPIDKVMGAFYKEGDVAQPEPWTEPMIDAGE